MALEGFAEHAEQAGGPGGARQARYEADLVCIALLAVATFAFYGSRLSLGVDLTDESYYATHLVDWLRNGFAGSQNRNLQQLSALILYGPMRLYVAATGGLDGLILFLRLLYAAMTTVSTVPVYLFLRRFGPAWTAALGAAFMIAFIPFGLPAPSYNTIALCGTTAGLSLFGLGMLDADGAGSRRARVHLLMAGAAVAAAVTALAYPTLALAPPALVVCLVAIGRDRAEHRLAFVYAGWCCVAAAMTFGILAAVFGLSRLRDMAEFTFLSAEIGGRAGSKLLFSYTQISHEPFATTAILGVILGPFLVAPKGSEQPFARLGVVFIACSAAMMWAGPVSWIKSHDIVLLGALFAPHIVFRIRGDIRGARVARVLVPASLIAGLITLATATNGIFNFFVGGTTAALLGLALLAAQVENRASRRSLGWVALSARKIPLLLAILVLAFVSQTKIYGEYPGGPVNSQPIARGPFKNLWTTPDKQRYVDELSKALRTLEGWAKTLAVFGPYAGVYLLSPMRPWAFSTYLIPTAMGVGAIEMTLDLYKRSPPDVIAITDGIDSYDRQGPFADVLSSYEDRKDVRVGYLQCNILGSRNSAYDK